MEKWVNLGNTYFLIQRQAIHTILLALCKSTELKDQVYLKGGLLLGIGYGSSRYTTDIDISNQSLFVEGGFDEKAFDKNLRLALLELNYDIRLKTQTVKRQPKTIAKYNSYQITVGYVQTTAAANQLARLDKGLASTVIKMDYSFNEGVHDESEITVFGEEEIKTYGLLTLLAEKYRAILQQLTRNQGSRVSGRRQDVYDLHYLITGDHVLSVDKEALKQIFIDKCENRGLEGVNELSLDNPEVKKRAGTDYGTLKDEIQGELPDFDEAFDVVRNFYKSFFEDVS